MLKTNIYFYIEIFYMEAYINVLIDLILKGFNMETKGGFLITQVKQKQDKIFSCLLEAHGLTFSGAQGRILFVLWQEGAVTMGQLSQKTGLAGSGLTSTVDRMVKKGLLTREHPKENRRQVKVSLTKEAQLQKDLFANVSAKMGELFYQGFSMEDIKKFEDYLERLLVNLDEYEIRLDE